MRSDLIPIYEANLADFGRLADDQLMGLTIYAEARGEGREGRVAVGTVILERVDHRKWDGETVQEVCLWPLQFSCFNPHDKNRDILLKIAQDWPGKYQTSKPLQECFCIARGMIEGRIHRDPDLSTVHCCQYMTPAAAKKTAWDDKMKIIKTIGGHVFYA